MEALDVPLDVVPDVVYWLRKGVYIRVDVQLDQRRRDVLDGAPASPSGSVFKSVVSRALSVGHLGGNGRSGGRPSGVDFNTSSNSIPEAGGKGCCGCAGTGSKGVVYGIASLAKAF